MNGTGASATYSFLSWTRQGLANALTGAPPAGSLRPSLSVVVEVESNTGEVRPTAKSVNLIGPGDIVGISPKAIIRQEPGNWVKDFLPNYLPFIEFYDEDFPWRHSPEVPDENKDQLRPWIALVVLSEDEFEDLPASGPLSAIKTRQTAEKVFPPSSQLWAWAHVQVNADIATDSDGTPLSRGEVAARLAALVAQNPDIACSRLICPRKLEPRKAYHAFLIPSYETGRRAGLGLSMDAAVTAVTPSWGAGQLEFPYYHRWEFGTASRGDFEYLVGLLKPRPVDPRVGTRDMDVGDPGGLVRSPNVPVLALEGALRSPATTPTPWPSHYPDAFQKDIADFINAADGVQQAAMASDPVITPPLYGRWHALHPNLSLAAAADNDPYDPNAKWITELNLDPRHRTAAGLGTLVVQQKQEELMNQAWWQVGDILEANRKILYGQVASAASGAIYDKTIAPGASETLLSLSQPLHGQILGSEETIHHKVRQSRLPAGALSPTFRRLVRPRGKVARAAFPQADMRPQTRLLDRINRGQITHAPPKQPPASATTLANIAAEMNAVSIPPWLSRPASQLLLSGLIAILRAVLAILRSATAPVTAPLLAGITNATANAVAALVALRMRPRARAALREASFMPQAVAAMPPNADFRLTAPEQDVAFRPGGTDSAESTRFKSALRGMAEQLDVKTPPEPEKAPLDLAHIDRAIKTGINPSITIPGRVFSSMDLAASYLNQVAETFVPVLAYPKFRRPMYEALRDLSIDYLIPNMHLVPNNTISLLQENRRFIEAYMVGLNHEMARELLWREYPTDNRGSYFRQFWDVRDSLPSAKVTAAAWEEQGKDIREIHTWSMHAALGAHPNRPANPAGGDKAILLIRGALLNRFPNVVIYAHRANWQFKPDGTTPNKAKPRTLAVSTTEEERASNEKYPLYSATAAPDVFFLGFDLGVAEAKGLGEDAGWFFAIKQRPGETLFGLDIEDTPSSTPLLQWDDLTWEDLGAVTNNHILLPSDPAHVRPTQSAEILGQPLTWSDASNAAALATILYQDPVLVAVHAKEMLP